MRTMTSTIVAAALLAGGSTFAIAQNQAADGRNTEMNRQQGWQDGATRFEQRSLLRQQMRREGFRDIRISDAMFVVQARTPDGRTVLMVVNPADRGQQQMSGRMQDMQRLMQDQRQRQMGQMQGQMRDQMQGQMLDQKQGQMRDRQQARSQEYPLDGGAQYSAREQRGEFGTEQFGTSPTPQFSQAEQQNRNRQAAAGDQQTGAVGGTDRMSEDQLRSRLERRGFSNFSDWERDGDTVTATADWYGEEVDLRVNARTGEVLQPTRIETSQVGPLLESRGFSNIRNVRREGDTIHAEADRQGESFVIQIDPREARIEDRNRQGG